MAKAKKTPSGKWRVLAYVGKDKDGKRKYKSFTGTDRKLVERQAAEYVDEHRTIRDSASFQSALDSFLESRKAVLSPSTFRGYNNIAKYLKENYEGFCESSVYDIDSDMMQELVNDMVENGQSPKSIANKIGLISSVMKSRQAKMPYVHLPEKVKPKYHVPDVDEVESLVKCAEGKDIEIPILLAAYGGMRRSEICALTMDDINGDTISIRKAIVVDNDLNLVEKSTKTYDSARNVPMPHSIIEKIVEKGYITDAENPERISERFHHIARQAGCPETRFHDLRHFHASYLHSKGIPDQYIMSRCGWKTDAVMKKVYRHTLESEVNQYNKKINNYIETLMR